MGDDIICATGKSQDIHAHSQTQLCWHLICTFCHLHIKNFIHCSVNFNFHKFPHRTRTRTRTHTQAGTEAAGCGSGTGTHLMLSQVMRCQRVVWWNCPLAMPTMGKVLYVIKSSRMAWRQTCLIWNCSCWSTMCSSYSLLISSRQVMKYSSNCCRVVNPKMESLESRIQSGYECQFNYR